MVQVGVEAQTTAARYVAGFPPMMIEGFLTERRCWRSRINLTIDVLSVRCGVEFSDVASSSFIHRGAVVGSLAPQYHSSM